MTQQRLIMAIGRIERALSRLERYQPSIATHPEQDAELHAKHEKLKAEAQAAIREIDQLLAGTG